jgi:TPR repeat protein
MEKYFKLAAVQILADAQFHYNFCYLQGIGFPMNKSEKARYLKLEADQNDMAAHNNYGRCLQDGISVPMNKFIQLLCLGHRVVEK